MSRTMHDAVYAGNIPADATLVAGYIDAGFAWSTDDWARFPHAVKVRIVVDPSVNDGHVIDIEPGNWEPPSAPAWCRMRRAAGMTPTVYTMGSWWRWCRDEFDQRGEPQPHYWIADWDNDATLPTGAVAKQYANGDMLGTGYDLSIVADHWPSIDIEAEADMPLSDEDVNRVAHAVRSADIPVSDWAVDAGLVPDGAEYWASTYWRNSYQHSLAANRKLDGMRGELLQAIKAVADGRAVEVDTGTIVEGVLAGLSAGQIADALPDDLAGALVDELVRRLSRSEE